MRIPLRRNELSTIADFGSAAVVMSNHDDWHTVYLFKDGQPIGAYCLKEYPDEFPLKVIGLIKENPLADFIEVDIMEVDL